MPAYVTTFHSEIFSTVFLIVHTTMVIVLPVERFTGTGRICLHGISVKAENFSRRRCSSVSVRLFVCRLKLMAAGAYRVDHSCCAIPS